MSTSSENMVLWERQRIIENQFNKKLIQKKLHEYLLTEHYSYINQGVTLVKSWLDKTYYESKNKRLSLVKSLDLHELVSNILVGTLYCQSEELFTSTSARLAGMLDWSDKPDAIKTMAELLGVLCHTDAYDIGRNDANSMVVLSRLKLTNELVTFIENTMFMPPMICEPLPLRNNSDSGYFTLKTPVILGKGNMHSDDVCLDAINIANSVPLALNKEFLSYLEMNPSFTFETKEQEQQWNNFKKNSYKLMVLLAKCKKFWFTHAYDKRGRMYSKGYMVNTQGMPFQKACIDFAQTETIEVPIEYRS